MNLLQPKINETGSYMGSNLTVCLYQFVFAVTHSILQHTQLVLTKRDTNVWRSNSNNKILWNFKKSSSFTHSIVWTTWNNLSNTSIPLLFVSLEEQQLKYTSGVNPIMVNVGADWGASSAYLSCVEDQIHFRLLLHMHVSSHSHKVGLIFKTCRNFAMCVYIFLFVTQHTVAS